MTAWCPVAHKLSFRDRDTAEAELVKARIKHRGQRHIEKRVYPCLSCDGWHLTSQAIPQRPRRYRKTRI